MNELKKKKIIGSSMVAIGLLQVFYGVLSDNLFYGTLGLAYALIGVAYFWFEGYAIEQ